MIGGAMIIVATFFHIALVFFERENLDDEENAAEETEAKTKVVV